MGAPHLPLSQARLKAWAHVAFVEHSKRTPLRFHGVDVPAELFPWTVSVFNTLCDSTSTPFKRRRALARLALATVRAAAAVRR